MARWQIQFKLLALSWKSQHLPGVTGGHSWLNCQDSERICSWFNGTRGCCHPCWGCECTFLVCIWCWCWLGGRPHIGTDSGGLIRPVGRSCSSCGPWLWETGLRVRLLWFDAGQESEDAILHWPGLKKGALWLTNSKHLHLMMSTTIACGSSIVCTFSSNAHGWGAALCSKLSIRSPIPSRSPCHPTNPWHRSSMTSSGSQLGIGCQRAFRRSL